MPITLSEKPTSLGKQLNQQLQHFAVVEFGIKELFPDLLGDLLPNNIPDVVSADPFAASIRYRAVLGKVLCRKPIANGSSLEGSGSVEIQAKQRWSQAEADAAIKRLIDKYSELLASARKNNAGAIKEIPKIFGRNKIRDNLGCSGELVSDSEPWRRIADEFELSKQKTQAKKKIGHELAIEEAALTVDDNHEDEVDRRDLIQAVRKFRFPSEYIEANGDPEEVRRELLDGLLNGTINTDAGQGILDIVENAGSVTTSKWSRPPLTRFLSGNTY